MKFALAVLRDVRLDEMDENSRKAHQGTWMMMSAVYTQQQLLMRRQSAVEDTIAMLKEKIQQMSAH